MTFNIYLPLLMFAVIFIGLFYKMDYLKRFMFPSILMAIIMLIAYFTNFAPQFGTKNVINSFDYYVTGAAALIITYPLVAYEPKANPTKLSLILQKICMFLIFSFIMLSSFFHLNHELQGILFYEYYSYIPNTMTNRILVEVSLYLVLIMLPLSWLYRVNNYVILIACLLFCIGFITNLAHHHSFDTFLDLNFRILQLNFPDLLLLDIATAMFLPLAVTVINIINKTDANSNFTYLNLIQSPNTTQPKFFKVVTLFSVPLIFFGLILYMINYSEDANLGYTTRPIIIIMSILTFLMMKYCLVDVCKPVKTSSHKPKTWFKPKVLILWLPALLIILVQFYDEMSLGESFISSFYEFNFLLLANIGFILIPIQNSQAPKFFKVLAYIFTLIPLGIALYDISNILF